ncbi:MAG: ADOP family duplicated permease, partial [Bryobacteraceae bacterium]
ILGVLPQGFEGLTGQAQIWIPLMTIDAEELEGAYNHSYRLVARRKADVSEQEARAAVTLLGRRIDAQYPDSHDSKWGAAAVPMDDERIDPLVRQAVLLLLAAVAAVLLIVCVNLSNLLLARGAARRREIALRGAIGAGRARVIRQLLTESLVLSIIGGCLGVAFAYAAVSYVRRFDGLSIPLLKNVSIDPAALGIALGFSLLTAVLFGLAPAVTAARADLASVINGSARGSSDSHDHRLVRSSLVVSQVALACLLLVGAGLLLRSFLHVLDINLGFQADSTYALRVDAGADVDSPEKFRAYLRRLISAARDVPGVAAASITDAVPLDSNRSWGVQAKGQPPDRQVGALVKVIGPGLMHAMRTPLLAGREFADHDDATSAPVVLINQSLAEELWPGRDPLLESLRLAGADRRVVGVVADVRHLSVEESSGPEFYLPILQMRTMSPSLVVRTRRPLSEVGPSLRQALAGVAPDLPTAGFRPLRQIIDRALSPRRFFVSLLIAFAAAALMLAAIGIYGVISYSVTRRTPEIGIRMALGASSGRIRAGVVGDTLRLALAGAAIGIAGAVALTSFLSSMLFGLSPADPWAYAGAAAILLLVALAAGFLPAFRASRISPMNALRAD